MMNELAEHPTVIAVRERGLPIRDASRVLDAAWLRKLCLAAGADDVGFVSLDRPEIADQKADILAAFPRTRTLVSLVFGLNRAPIRSPARSAANLEFHSRQDHANETAHRIVHTLEQAGIAAMNPAAGFPMEMDQFPRKVWVVGHKPVAEAAGLGHVGLHHMVIHPRWGSFISLDTILVAAAVTQQDQPLDFNPCLKCKLCVAACPVGAISPDGDFNFSACYNHNYHEFMGGFTNWVEQIAASGSSVGYRRQVTDSESASMWQSLTFGPNYKSAYCMAVCPAGEEVIGPFLANRPQFLSEVVRPLQEKREPVYVVPGSDAEAHVAQRFPHKMIRRVRSGLRPASITGFLEGMAWTFQPKQSAGLNATYHFTFTGQEPCRATVDIRQQTLQVRDGHVGQADLVVTADSTTWIAFLRRERSMVWALITRRIRLRGSPRLLLRFGKCFPS